jgi:hypothetical protein
METHVDSPTGHPMSEPAIVDDDKFNELILELNQNYGVVCLNGTTLVIRNSFHPSSKTRQVQFLTFKDFRELFHNKNYCLTSKSSSGKLSMEMVNLGTKWLKHPLRKDYEDVVFSPGLEVPDSVFNLWQGFAITPIKGNSDLFWQHLEQIICANDHESYLFARRWMAHAVQKTAELPRTALVMMGQQGIGKGVFISALQRIFGGHYMECTDIEDFVGKFNGHLKDKVCLHANEATWGGDKRKEGGLKALITDPLRKCEMKGKDAFTVNNYARLLISSNNEWVVPADKDDRRFVFLNVSAEKKGDHEYFAQLMNCLENGGYEAVLYDLMNEDISGFNPTIKPSASNLNSSDQIRRGMLTHDQFIEEWLNEAGPDQLKECVHGHLLGLRQLLIHDFYEQYIEFHNRIEQRRPALSFRQFCGQISGANGKPGLLPVVQKVQVKAVNTVGKATRPQAYVIPDVKQCRQHWETSVVHCTWDWDSPVSEEDFEKQLTSPAETLLQDSEW